MINYSWLFFVYSTSKKARVSLLVHLHEEAASCRLNLHIIVKEELFERMQKLHFIVYMMIASWLTSSVVTRPLIEHHAVRNSTILHHVTRSDHQLRLKRILEDFFKKRRIPFHFFPVLQKGRKDKVKDAVSELYRKRSGLMMSEISKRIPEIFIDYLHKEKADD